MKKKVVSLVLAVVMLVGMIPISSSAAESFLWPVPSCKDLSQSYHSGHEAIDISGAGIAGQDIVSTKTGTVVLWFNQCTHEHGGIGEACGNATYGFGNGLMIKNDDGTFASYCHMKYNSIPAAYRTVGARVSQGAVIGKVGSAGWSTGYHLHFRLGWDKFSNPINNMPGNISYSYSVPSPNVSAELGTNFYAAIINTASWLHASNEGNVVGRKNYGDINLVWYFERLGDGTYKILSAKDGSCLEANDFQTANGTNVQTYGYNGNDAQRWVITGSSAEFYFRPKYCDKVIDFTSSSHADGTNIQLWEKNGTEAQKLQIWFIDNATSKLSAQVNGNSVAFSWTKDVKAMEYSLRILKDGVSYKDVWKIKECEITVDLEPGTYQAYVDAGNAVGYKKSNDVSFTVAEAAENPEEPPEELPGVPEEFSDVKPTDWYYSSVMWAATKGLFSGVSSTQFDPEGKMNRGMLATVLYRMAGTPAVSGSSGFPDVPANAYYSKAAAWAASKGIIQGNNGKFQPNHNVTREQLATMLYRYAKLSGDPGSNGNLGSFNDAGSVSSYAKEAMSWAVGEGIITGEGGVRLNPQGSATRAQVATMLQRYSE